jgi:CRISPR/Cas system type I-B associated protein Csh2 (Cas7 group RAMP superfamily)
MIQVTLKRKIRNAIMSNTNSVVAVFESHEQAEDAIRELQKDGFDMKKLSIVGTDVHTDEHVVGYYNAGATA